MPLDVLGQRDRLSNLDIRKINTLYKCNGQAKDSPSTPLQPVDFEQTFLSSLASQHHELQNNNKYAPPKARRLTPTYASSVHDSRSSQLLTPNSYHTSAKLTNAVQDSSNPCAIGFEPDAFVNTANGELLIVRSKHISKAKGPYIFFNFLSEGFLQILLRRRSYMDC